MSASVQTLRISRAVELINVSSTGAKLRGTQLPAKGETIVVKVGPVDTIGTVVWHGDGLCGVTFDEDLTYEEVLYLQTEGTRTAMANLTPEERLAAEDWINGFAR